MILLDPEARFKPLDFGADGVTGSLDRDGRLIALNSFHPAHGYVTLTTAEPFPEAKRYDPAAVREYRAALPALAGFGLLSNRDVVSRSWRLVEDTLPQVTLQFADGESVEITTFAYDGGAVQFYRNVSVGSQWCGPLSLQRCAYTQLTEGGPVPMPPLVTDARFENRVLTVTNPALPWSVAIAGFQEGPAWCGNADAPLDIQLELPSGSVVLHVAFAPTPEAAVQQVRRLQDTLTLDRLETLAALWQDRWADMPDDPLLRRGLTYGLAMAIPVGETVCILTDHMLLPLSWNRDSYYVARALLNWRPDMADVVRRHLLWLFEQAERVDGAWGRSYLANGRVKDRAFQLDQQLFPLLELAEYSLHTGDRDLLRRLRGHVEAALDMIMARKAPHALLFPTEETPADDPIRLPYHLSSHILLWRLLRKLKDVGLDGKWPPLADDLRATIQRTFVAPKDGKRLYAYATDGSERFHFYHDANDFPLVLAPAWGFVTPDDPVWRATVEFAFSEANEGGYYAGRLGSVHTRAAWPLGDVQEIIVARAMNDREREQRARRHLRRAAFWDGALPEAVDPATGAVVSRTWFAWPNAALACVDLGAFDG